MATAVYESVDTVLQDGTQVTLKPLAIGRLRRFQKVWEKFKDVGEDQDASLDIFIQLSGICLSVELSELIENQYDEKTKEITEEYKNYLEDVLDMETIYKVIEVCAGMKLNDPNLLAAVAQAMEDGQN